MMIRARPGQGLEILAAPNRASLSDLRGQLCARHIPVTVMMTVSHWHESLPVALRLAAARAMIKSGSGPGDE